TSSIMGMYTPPMLPVLAGLAKGYAVCDHWYASVPSQTIPNRAFALAGTSLGWVKNSEGRFFATKSIFGALDDQHGSWRIYGYSGLPLTALDSPDTKARAKKPHLGKSADFLADAAAGKLPAFAFLEPAWAKYTIAPATNEQQQNDQHPVSSIA